MLTNLLTDQVSTLNISTLSICGVVSIVLGLLIALAHKYTSKASKNYLTTIALLPFLVQVVIILVNGNLGTGVAIMGAFSLVRFRSLPGDAKEILSVFFAMTVGLAIGTGYVVFAILVTILGCLFLLLYSNIKIFDKNKNEKILKIVISEELDYTEVFNNEFNNYLDNYDLIKSKTIDMGSMYELTYKVILKDEKQEKKFIDDLRIKNGNLKISLSHPLGEECL